jgi:cell division protein FtsI/penicillin-binding protein 2
LGYVGGDTPQYTIVVYNIEPHGYGGFAGAQTGQPVFAEIAHMLINNYDVKPKKS